MNDNKEIKTDGKIAPNKENTSSTKQKNEPTKKPASSSDDSDSSDDDSDTPKNSKKPNNSDSSDSSDGSESSDDDSDSSNNSSSSSDSGNIHFGQVWREFGQIRSNANTNWGFLELITKLHLLFDLFMLNFCQILSNFIKFSPKISLIFRHIFAKFFGISSKFLSLHTYRFS